jgi:uncharacterized damage-inducible protein DinB
MRAILGTYDARTTFTILTPGFWIPRDREGCMHADAFRELYHYNHWATEQVLDAASGLTQEQLLAPGTAGRGSIRDTLVHLVSAQMRWLAWWDNTHSAEEAYLIHLNEADYPDLASVRAVWTESDRSLRAFVDSLTDADLDRDITAALRDGRVFHLPLWKMLLHVSTHGTQHRSEVAAMLTAFGHSPGNLDALVYFRPFGNSQEGR